ncbi:MAG: ATP-binding protein [Labedaea sp.]
MVAQPARDLLTLLCADLRLLWTQADGPSLRELERQLTLSKSQIWAILNGRIRRLPDWRVISGLIDGIHRHAATHGRVDRLSLRIGVEEYWRPRFALLEHAFGHDGGRVPGETRPSDAVPPNAAPVVPALLPAAVAGFVDREEPLAELDFLLASWTRSENLIIAIDGSAGVGKTTLATHWAHRVAEKFPDGQLYVNLRGFDPGGSVLDPSEAIRGFLEMLGIPVERMPADLAARIGLYRSVLAGKRILVVLDNARDVEQVRPLLPGVAGCLVVVTSRNQLLPLVAIEGAHPLTLDLLSTQEARELLIRRLGTYRTTAEPDAVEELIARCARLPLALAVVAARAATQPGWSLRQIVAELRATADTFDALRGGDPTTDIRLVFSWSYRTLSTAAAHLFRLLGLHPGPDFGLPAMASLAELPAQDAGAVRDELVRAHLITERAPGRYDFHDLLRAYAHDETHTVDSAEQRQLAVRRLIEHYLRTARAAAAVLDPHHDLGEDVVTTPPLVEPGGLDDHDRAMAWFTAERAVLLAAVEQAAMARLDTHCWQLAWTLTAFLHRRGHWQDQAGAQDIALAAARRLADQRGQGYAHRGLGLAAAGSGRLDDAREHYLHALDLFDTLGDRPGAALIQESLAWIAGEQGRYQDALGHARAAFDHSRAAGNRVDQARALNTIGWYQARLGQHQRALDHCQQALTLQQNIGDLYGEAHTLDSIGYVHHQLGQYDQAISRYRQALDLFRATGNRFTEATCLAYLGDTKHAAGDPDAARTNWQIAADILDELAHPEAAQIRNKLHLLAACPDTPVQAGAAAPGGQRD